MHSSAVFDTVTIVGSGRQAWRGACAQSLLQILHYKRDRAFAFDALFDEESVHPDKQWKHRPGRRHHPGVDQHILAAVLDAQLEVRKKRLSPIENLMPATTVKCREFTLQENN